MLKTNMWLAVGLCCVLWHLIWGDPTSIKGPHGWVPLFGFFCGIMTLVTQ